MAGRLEEREYSEHDGDRKDHQHQQQAAKERGEHDEQDSPNADAEGVTQIDCTIEVALRDGDREHRVADDEGEDHDDADADECTRMCDDQLRIAHRIALNDAVDDAGRHGKRAHRHELRIEAAQQLKARVHELGRATRTNFHCWQATSSKESRAVFAARRRRRRVHIG